jgi:hypothetical protein
MPDSRRVYASRNVRLFHAPFDTTIALPDDDIAWGTAWGAPWEELGYTQDGIVLRLTLEREEITVDQLVDPVLMPASSREIAIETQLAEWTGENLARGFGQGEVTTSAPAVGTKGFTDYTLGGDIVEDFGSWGLDFQKPYDGEPIRTIGYRGLATGDVEATFGKVDESLNIPVTVRFLPDDSVDPARLLIVHDVIPALAGP